MILRTPLSVIGYMQPSGGYHCEVKIQAQSFAREGGGARERLREQGLRPIQIWVPDVRSQAFRTEAHRQSLKLTAISRASWARF
jgi:hypothetical protein